MTRNLTRLVALAAAALALSAAAPSQAQTTGGEGFGDFVWNDLNHNGIQDTGEPGLAGITVNLFSSADNFASVFATTTTDAAGHYFLGTGPNALNHNWELQFVLPGGFAFTLADQGANDALDSDVIDALTGRTALIPGFTFPVSGDPILTVDAGMFATTTVPEPGAASLLAAALAALVAVEARRRRSR